MSALSTLQRTGPLMPPSMWRRMASAMAMAGAAAVLAAVDVAAAVPLGAGDTCPEAIDLGVLDPDAVLPVVTRPAEPQPIGADDYRPIEPSFGNVLDQPETCYAFTPAVDGWVQIAASPVRNQARVIFSDDDGLSFQVSHECWSDSNGGYAEAPQYGAPVQQGTRYCFCIDSSGQPVVDAGDLWNLDVFLWPATTASNTDCAHSEAIDFCPGPNQERRFLSTAAAGRDPGIPGSAGCSPGFWGECSGQGADLNYHLVYTQAMADCGCNELLVGQTAPFVGATSARVCDAALQVATGCPPTAATCAAAIDDFVPGGSEIANLTGLGPSDVGTTFFIQLDHYMASACPSFDAIFRLLGCAPGCDLCGCVGVAPSGSIGNDLRAVRESDDVALSWPTATVDPPRYAVLKTADRSQVEPTAIGIGDELPVTVTSESSAADRGVVSASSTTWYYQVLPADSCSAYVLP